MIPTREEVSTVLNNLRNHTIRYGFSLFPNELYNGILRRDFRIEQWQNFDDLSISIKIVYFGPTDYSPTDRLEVRFTVSRRSMLNRNLTRRNINPFEDRVLGNFIVPNIPPIPSCRELGITNTNLVPEPLTLERLREVYTALEIESIQNPSWFGLDFAREYIQEPSKSFKPHPPYPLIGLEWEPQLTLLNHSNQAVYVINNIVEKISIEECPMDAKTIYLYLTKEYQKNIDNSNLEFRTPPVKFEDLPQEIEKAQMEMENLIKAIAKELGPTGVFLPASPCSKHVNVSGVNYGNYIIRKPGEYGERYHIQVPYIFTNYNEFLDPRYRLLSIQQKEPILLGYSMAGETYVKRSDLV